MTASAQRSDANAQHAATQIKLNKLDVRRVIQVLLPNVPVPMVDYALNTEMASSLVGVPGTVGEPAEKRGFVLSSTERARVSDFVELHLLSPSGGGLQGPSLGGRHRGRASFGDLTQMEFSLHSDHASSSGRLPAAPPALRPALLPHGLLLRTSSNGSPPAAAITSPPLMTRHGTTPRPTSRPGAAAAAAARQQQQQALQLSVATPFTEDEDDV
ncbi:hypothetical protein FOA52_010053 [Chlamydomonas sp. UWO 241]|nr:hypothetical protein FOA52_010053 [Chlamydomonas sp. UWO 241]